MINKRKDTLNKQNIKKNRKNTVQKWVMAIVAISMVASMVAGVVAPAVFAKAETKSVSQTDTPQKKNTPIGTWYGKIFGISVTLDLKDGGAYYIDFEGRNEETGTWVMDGDNVITDKGDDSETTYTFNGDSLITKVNGAKMKLTKDKSNLTKTESDKVQNKDAVESDFEGVWTADTVSIGKLSAEPSTFGITNAFLNIKNSKVDIYIDGTILNKPIQADALDGTLKNGTLTCTIKNGNQTFKLSTVIFKDSTIMCVLKTDEYEMNFYMKKSTEKELKKAKTTKETTKTEEKSTDSTDISESEANSSYIDSDGTSTAKTKDIKPGTTGASAHTN